MPRVWGVGLLIVVLIAMPVMVSAQGILRGTKCADPGSALDLYVGYATNLGWTQYTDHVAGSGDLDLDYATTHALYLGATLPIPLGDWGFFRPAGSITIPSSAKVENTLPEPIGIHERDFSGDTLWGTVEGLQYCPVVPGVFAVGGFRWDHWQTSFTNPSNLNPFLPFLATTDTADFTLNAYLPLLGIVTYWRGLSFGVLGFPVTFGDIQVRSSLNGLDPNRLFVQGTYNSGHFIEFVTEWSLSSVSMAGSGIAGDISLFAKFSSLAATDTISYWQQAGPFATPKFETDFSFKRKLLVIGGKATINFNLPDFRSMI